MTWRISLCHAVAGNRLAELELPHGSSVLDLYAAASSALERHSSTFHLVKDGKELRGHGESLEEGCLELEVIFVPGGRLMAAAAQGLWALGLVQEPKVIHTFPDPEAVEAMIFARDAELLAVRTKTCVRVLDLSTSSEIFVWDTRAACVSGPSPKVMDFVACRQHSKLALLDGETLKVFDVHLKECMLEAVGCFEICSFSSDGLYVITGGDCGGPPAVWNLTSKESLLLTDHLTDGYFTSCIFSPDVSMMVTASREPNWEEVLLWSSEGRLMQRLPTWAIYNMAFVADRMLVGIAEDARVIHVLSVPSGDLLSSFTLDVVAGAWPKLRLVRFLPRALQSDPSSFLVIFGCTEGSVYVSECLEANSGEEPATVLRSFSGFESGIDALS